MVHYVTGVRHKNIHRRRINTYKLCQEKDGRLVIVDKQDRPAPAVHQCRKRRTLLIA